MKPFPLLILVLTAALPFGAAAQTTVSSIEFTPPTFYVGDRVVMSLELSLDRPLALNEPEELPESDWAEILQISAGSEGRTAAVTVTFIPFAPGTRTLPDLNLGALTLTDLKVPTRSVLDDRHEGVRSLRGQLLLPGTRLAVALILALLAMAPFLGFNLVRQIWKQFIHLQEVWRMGRPARKLRRILKNLRLQIGDQGASTWFAVLTDALRTYLSARTGRDCTSATTAEIAEMPVFSDSEGPASRILDVLRDGDMVKFAGQFADDRRLEKTLDGVESAVQSWEKSGDQL